mmetsp:Transcript_17134/g.31599  ORF Transcript_17134/g.31599 Transcript_17134/m.31599 type:complete len:217 (-) Transcript_17134:437-1087(-)
MHGSRHGTTFEASCKKIFQRRNVHSKAMKLQLQRHGSWSGHCGHVHWFHASTYVRSSQWAQHEAACESRRPGYGRLSSTPGSPLIVDDADGHTTSTWQIFERQNPILLGAKQHRWRPILSGRVLQECAELRRWQSSGSKQLPWLTKCTAPSLNNQGVFCALKESMKCIVLAQAKVMDSHELEFQVCIRRATGGPYIERSCLGDVLCASAPVAQADL